LQIVPTDTRLPGYPAFLAAIFWLFGVGNFRAVMLTQILVDLGTCLIVADLARPTLSERAARIAFVLAALCPFLANYASAVLTETLEIFFTALALDGAAAALNRMHAARSAAKVAPASSGPRPARRLRPAFCCVPMAASCWRRSLFIWQI
jgi:4-amino-4-deoxy-L-arabinose transferase-like glycosyltransferase